MKDKLLQIKNIISKDILKKEPEHFPYYFFFGFIAYSLASGSITQHIRNKIILFKKKKELINKGKYVL